MSGAEYMAVTLGGSRFILSGITILVAVHVLWAPILLMSGQDLIRSIHN